MKETKVSVDGERGPIGQFSSPELRFVRMFDLKFLHMYRSQIFFPDIPREQASWGRIPEIGNIWADAVGKSQEVRSKVDFQAISRVAKALWGKFLNMCDQHLHMISFREQGSCPKCVMIFNIGESDHRERRSGQETSISPQQFFGCQSDLSLGPNTLSERWDFSRIFSSILFETSMGHTWWKYRIVNSHLNFGESMGERVRAHSKVVWIDIFLIQPLKSPNNATTLTIMRLYPMTFIDKIGILIRVNLSGVEDVHDGETDPGNDRKVPRLTVPNPLQWRWLLISPNKSYQRVAVLSNKFSARPGHLNI